MLKILKTHNLSLSFIKNITLNDSFSRRCSPIMGNRFLSRCCLFTQKRKLL